MINLKQQLLRPFFNSTRYWSRRYRKRRTSGLGSYGNFAQYKSHVINEFLDSMEISSAIEFGCGDGAQLALCRYPSYLGFDVSSSAIVECQSRFAGVSCQQFKLLDDYQGERADLTLSLDVIYHLVKQDVYEAHLRLLFDSSDRYVIVFSTDHDTKAIENSRHCRHRCFTDWVQEHRPEFVLTDVQTNKSANPNAAKFYIFEKEC